MQLYASGVLDVLLQGILCKDEQDTGTCKVSIREEKKRTDWECSHVYIKWNMLPAQGAR